MDNLTDTYSRIFNLGQSKFTRIDHDDAMVAIVYRVTWPNGSECILKVCTQHGEFLRESYFLNFFSEKLPVPRIMDTVKPANGVFGAILMECLQGSVMKSEEMTKKLAYEIGSLLACIHLNRAEGYGDLTKPHELNKDPKTHFTLKFDEGLAECSGHLPQELVEKCRAFYEDNVHLLDSVDGPCIIHRDFRPGNVIIQNGKIQGIIDWASGRAGFAEDDFCPFGQGEWTKDPVSKKAFLDGYASIRRIPDFERLMPFLKLNRAIAAIGFTVKRNTWNSSNARVYQNYRGLLDRFFETSIPGLS